MDAVADEPKPECDEESDEDLTELDALFDESVALIQQLEQSYEQSISKLYQIDVSIQQSSSIIIQGKDLDDILEELHAQALVDIESSGSSSFGTLLCDVLDKIETQ
jgi:hypothetical protein